MISMAFVKKAAPRMIATSATTNSITVDNTHLLSRTGRETRKSETIAACLPANGLALCALALATGREPRSVMTTGPPATAGGYSPISCNLTRSILVDGELLHLATETRTCATAHAGLDAPFGASPSRCTRGSERDKLAVSRLRREERA